jgi:hypothetical protein
MLRCINNDVRTITFGHQTTGKMQIIWSDELSCTLFSTSGRVYIWRILEEAYTPECLAPTAKHGRGSVVVWED